MEVIEPFRLFVDQAVRAVLAFAISSTWIHKFQGNYLHKKLDGRLKGIQPEPIYFWLVLTNSIKVIVWFCRSSFATVDSTFDSK